MKNNTETLENGVVKKIYTDSNLSKIVYETKLLKIDNRKNPRDYVLAFRYLNCDYIQNINIDEDGTAMIGNLNKTFEIEEFTIPANSEVEIPVKGINWEKSRLFDFQYLEYSNSSKFGFVNKVLQYCPQLEVGVRLIFNNLNNKLLNTKVTVDEYGQGKLDSYYCDPNQGAGRIKFFMEV